MSGLIHLFLVLLSPAVGSAAKCLADRYTLGSFAKGRSCCDYCGTPLRGADLIPIFSWLALRGRSRCCGETLAISLVLAEVAATAMTVWALWVTNPPISVVSVLLGWGLLALALIDLQHFRLPDAGTLPLILTGLALAAAGWTGPPMDHALGATFGFAALWGIRALYFLVRGREGLGLGDAKLLAAAGAWCGWTALPSVLLISCLIGLGLAVSLARNTGLRRTLAIPFGPALCMGFWITWLHGPLVLQLH